MKQSASKNRSTSSRSNKGLKAGHSDQGGSVQVAIWKDHPELQKIQDTYALYSNDVFYDFAKPLKLLDSPGWHPQIQAGFADGFFVFTVSGQNPVAFDDGGTEA